MTATLPPPVAARTPPPAAAPRMPGVVLPSLATGTAVLLASLSLSPVYASGAWFGATLLTVIAVVSAGAVATWLRAPVFLVPVIQAVVMFAALVSRFTVDAPLGFVPSSDALEQLRSVLAEGVHDVDQFAPPIPVTEGATAIAALGMGCLAIVVFVLQVALRMPVIAGVSLLAVYVVPALVLDDGAPWWSFAFVAIGFMVLLVSDERVGLAAWGRMLRRAEGDARSPLAGFSSAALRLGAIAVVAAVAIPVLVPALTDAVLGRHLTGVGGGTEGDPSGAGSIGLDPFVSLRTQILQQPNTPVFSYTTDAAKPDYLRAVVLTSYSGETWRPVAFELDNATRITDGVPVDDSLGADLAEAGAQVTTTVTDMALNTPYLPVPDHLSGLTVSGGSWFLDKLTRTVFAENAGTSTRRLTWTAQSVAASPTQAQLQAAPPISTVDLTDRQRRAAIPDTLRQLAVSWTQGAGSDYAKAVAVEKQLRTWTYSTNVSADDNPQAPSYLDQFLQSRTGYCQQYAATMALMAESLGIPARVVVGFTPGTRQPDGTYLVLGRNAHAWPELFFTGIGWQRFEPTPASAPSGVSTPSYSGDNAVTTPTGGPNPSASSSASVKPLRDERDPGSAGAFDGATTGEGTTADAWRARGFLALAVVALIVGLVPAVWRLVRRRRRLSEQAAVEDMWEELRDTARDLGVPWSMAHTPRQAASAVVSGQHLRGEAAEAAVRLGRATEQARYARTPPSTQGLAADVGTVRTALLRRAERGTKWRALLLPASLRDRR
jgi:transglutaminase-like putative cysteine protease